MEATKEVTLFGKKNTKEARMAPRFGQQDAP